MAECLTEPKKHLALDTDWASAAGMASLFIICAMLVVGRALQLLRGDWSPDPLTWQTWVVLAMCVWCIVRVHERRVQIVCLVVAIGPASRILLWLANESVETQITNAAFTRTIGGLMYLGACVYVMWWFKSKVTHV
jgi:hypothetical protein